MIKKIDIYEFLEKVQAKAVKAVEEKYEKEMDKAVNEYLDLPQNAEFKDAIDTLIKSCIKAVKAQEIIRKFAGRCNSYASIPDVKRNIFKDWYNPPEDCKKLWELRAEKENVLNKTKVEYAKIRAMVKNSKHGNAARDALEKLGFDVSYLDKNNNLPTVINPAEMTVDKELLFPCKESGI